MSIQNNKKLKVTLEYSNKTVNEEVDPYKTIKFLKEKAIKIFYPLNFEFRLLYLNKDLTNYENTPLGEYFKNKGSIQIKIQENKKMGSNNLTSINYNHSNNFNLEVVKINANKQNLTGNNQEYFDNRNYKTNDDYKIKIQNTETKTMNKPKKRKIDYNLSNDNSTNNLCQCNKDLIIFFCRTCNVFLCKDCRIDYKHQTHKSLHVDIESPEESVKLYAITLQSDINLNLKAGRIYSNNFQNKKFIDIESRKEIVVRKLSEIERRLEDKMKNLPQVDDKEFGNLLSNLQSRGNLANDELEDILDLIYKNNFKSHKKLSFDEMLKLFQHIFQKEREIDDLSNSIIAYKINYETHKKIDEMYKIIENAIDNILSTDLKQNKNLLNDSNIFTPEIIETMKNNKTANKGGDMNMEKKLKKREESNDGAIFPKNNENSIFSKNDLSVNNNDENFKRDIKFKRTVIEAIDKNNSNFDEGDAFEDAPLGIDMEYNNKIHNHNKKFTNRKIDSIDSSNVLRELGKQNTLNSQYTIKHKSDNRYMSVNKQRNSEENQGDLQFKDEI